MRPSPWILPALAAAVAMTACGEGVPPTIASLGAIHDTSAANGIPLTISPDTIALLAGATYQFRTNAPADLQKQVQWGSRQTTIAIISPAGFVTAVSPGAATITARYSLDTTNVATAAVVVTALTTP